MQRKARVAGSAMIRARKYQVTPDRTSGATSPENRSQITHLGKGVHRIVLRYGFMEQPDVPRDLDRLADKGVPFDPMRTSYFVGRNSFTASSKPLLPRWQRKLFLTQSRFAASAGDFFGLPANRVVELGSRIEI